MKEIYFQSIHPELGGTTEINAEAKRLANYDEQIKNIDAVLERGTMFVKAGHVSAYNPTGEASEIGLKPAQIARREEARQQLVVCRDALLTSLQTASQIEGFTQDQISSLQSSSSVL